MKFFTMKFRLFNMEREIFAIEIKSIEANIDIPEEIEETTLDKGT